MAPSLVIRGNRNAGYEFHLVEADEIARRVGAPLMAAFLKSFQGVDRLLAFEQLIELNAKHVEKDSPAQERNLHVLILSAAGTMYELGKALQELCNARVKTKLSKPVLWEPLNDLRAAWYTGRLPALLRNQLAFHLGELKIYRDSIADLFKRERDHVFIKTSAKGGRRAGQCELAWVALYNGTSLTDRELVDLVGQSRSARSKVDFHLHAAFRNVLEAAGVPLRNESDAFGKRR